MRAGDLAPDHSDLGTADLLLSLVDVGDLLAEIEAVWLSEPGTHTQTSPKSCSDDVRGSVGVVDTLDLDQAGAGVGDMSATLVGQVATPMNYLRQSRSSCLFVIVSSAE